MTAATWEEVSALLDAGRNDEALEAARTLVKTHETYKALLNDPIARGALGRIYAIQLEWARAKDAIEDLRGKPIEERTPGATPSLKLALRAANNLRDCCPANAFKLATELRAILAQADAIGWIEPIARVLAGEHGK